MSLRTLVPTLLLAFTLPAIAQDYKTTILPKLNGLNTVGFSMNASGQIVGVAPVPTGGQRNFVWSRQAGMVDIGAPEFGPWRINSPGTIAGSESVGGGHVHALIRTPDGAFQDLGTLGGNWSEAIGINDQGQVAGCSDTATSPPYVQDVFFWTASSGMQDLGASTGTTGCSFATAIGNGGQVVGTLTNNDVFVWTQGQAVEDLGFAGFPQAVNQAGAIVGLRCCGASNAFLWTRSGGVQDLGLLPGFVFSIASSINTHGQVVGTLGAADAGSTRAFIWSQATGMQLLPPTVPKWEAHAINDAGQILLERGTATRLLTPLMKVTLASSANPSHVGQPITFTATVTSVQGAPPDAENMVFKDGLKVLATVPLSSGSASFVISSLKTGTHTIVANYVGDVNYFSSKSVVLKQVVNP